MENITAYFDLLKEVFDELELRDHPECIYNMDKTGMPLEPHPLRIVAKKRSKKKSDIGHLVRKLKLQSLVVVMLWDKPNLLSLFMLLNS